MPQGPSGLAQRGLHAAGTAAVRREGHSTPGKLLPAPAEGGSPSFAKQQLEREAGSTFSSGPVSQDALRGREETGVAGWARTAPGTRPGGPCVRLSGHPARVTRQGRA